MFFKQSGYKPRTNSQSSGKSGSLAGSPPKDTTKTHATLANKEPLTGVTAAAAGRRRSSVDKFSGLQELKRNGDAQKTNYLEQKPGNPGVLGGMWNSFTKGT